MKKILTLLILTLIGFNGASVNAAQPIKLYKNYVFGTDQRKMKKIKGTYDCSESFEEGALCLDNQKFLGIDIEMAFRFYNNKLSQVYLMMFFNQPNNIKVFGALKKKFQLVLIKNMAGQNLDIVNLLKTKSNEQLRATISSFEQIAFASGEITYSFLETSTIKPYFSKSDNVPTLLKNSPRHLRGVDYQIFEDDEGTAFGHISFTAPIAIMQILNKEIKQQSEEF